jgi:hypothetical protein
MVIGVGGVALFGVFGIWCGIRGWSSSVRRGESAALGIAGLLSGIIGFVAWGISGLNLLANINVIQPP